MPPLQVHASQLSPVRPWLERRAAGRGPKQLAQPQSPSVTVNATIGCSVPRMAWPGVLRIVTHLAAIVQSTRSRAWYLTENGRAGPVAAAVNQSPLRCYAPCQAFAQLHVRQAHSCQTSPMLLSPSLPGRPASGRGSITKSYSMKSPPPQAIARNIFKRRIGQTSQSNLG